MFLNGFCGPGTFSTVLVLNVVCFFSQTGLALMGFSRYCPSSLDLTNFVVRSHGGATAEPRAGYLWPTALNLKVQESEIWESRNLESKKIKNMKLSECKSVPPKCGKVLTSRIKIIPALFGAIFDQFSHGQNMQETY